MEKPECELDIPVPKEETIARQDHHLDGVIQQIGQVGRFQIFNFTLLCVPIIFSRWSSMSFLLIASDVDYRCIVPSCDAANSSFHQPWLNFTTPLVDDAWVDCQQYQPIGDGCEPDSFNRSQVVDCVAGYKFLDDDETIATEFGIFCNDKWMLSMVGTVSYIGELLGLAVGGYFSDRYGRKVMLVGSGVLSSLVGMARSHAPDYYSFLILEFVNMAVGSSLLFTAFLLCVELVRSKHRIVAGMIVCSTIGLADAALGYLASIVHTWRVLLRVLYTPGLLHLLFICHVPESVRWLLSQSKELEAVAILRRAAVINGQELSEKELSELVRHNRKMLAQTGSAAGHYTVRHVCKALGQRTAKCCLLWLAIEFIGLSLMRNIKELSGSRFDNYIVMGVMQLPGILIAMLLMYRIGRRWTLAGCMNCCSILLLSMVALERFYPTAGEYLYFLAKTACTGSRFVMFFFTAEMFPTSCRNSLLCFCFMVGDIGSMLAPQTSLLKSYYKYTPHVLCAAVGTLSSALIWGLPETTNKVLPTTMEEARTLDSNQTIKQS